ncbi:MAG TPA: PspC domain-containing protein [Weissella thailandensis]|uniref:PspC domain-containing protein n=1 Tax=Weissella TaxID=46255 RepID=UPI001DE3205D|nr:MULTISPECIES: PspC domain-containing protein [Weissella]HJG84886.1 PspC domain-containing protein [Weissella thailandensis]
MAKDKKLTKSNDRVLSGVLGGISEYFDLDASLVRLLFVAATLFTGFFPFVFIYIIAVFIMPDSPSKHQYKYRFDENAEEKRRDVTPDEDDEI